MCGDTVEFCMRMHFGRDFPGRIREDGDEAASFRAFHSSRLCGIQLRLTPRNYISADPPVPLALRHPSPLLAGSPSFAWLSLIEIQDAP